MSKNSRKLNYFTYSIKYGLSDGIKGDGNKKKIIVRDLLYILTYILYLKFV